MNKNLYSDSTFLEAKKGGENKIKTWHEMLEAEQDKNLRAHHFQHKQQS